MGKKKNIHSKKSGWSSNERATRKLTPTNMENNNHCMHSDINTIRETIL